MMGRLKVLLGLLGVALTADPAYAQFRSLQNPSFELNDPAGPGAPNFEIMPSASVPGWDTTTNEIELWDSNFNGVPAQDGNVFAEMNANVNGTFYQNICLVAGEPVGWTFAHRARPGGANTQTVRFQVATSTGSVIQTLATQASTTSNERWNVNSGTATYAGTTGLRRVQFTTSDPGSFGNFLDAIQLTLRPFIQLSIGSSSGSEDIPSANLATLLVTGRAPNAITVNMTITGGTATRGTDYTTPGGGASFSVTIPAGTYNNTPIPLGITIVNDTTIESSETITYALSTGTGYTLGNTTTCGGALQSTGTYTIIDNDARVTLRKQWANAIVGDSASITLSRGATVIDTFVSSASSANDGDTDGSPTPVVFGETVVLNEVLAGTNAARYNQAVACTGAADTNLADGLTIAIGETSITCTYTNTRIPPLLVSKTSVIVSDGISATGPKALPGAILRYCILVTNPGTLAAGDVTITDTLPPTLTYQPGSARSGTTCANATTVEDDNATGADETDPFGTSFSATTLTGYAASLAAGASFAINFNALLN
ncbi:DUF11 domain-containing protein [Novosphingobium sp.]|uniref:DUF11 domain-containing protein n=1 Tax=Novosphingobium sp. TaxID=1874826 RepID=UPI0026099F04|nr:DUF11 domain-containing protein [Novosphingobium sp.]